MGMATVVDMTLPTDQFALPTTFERVPDATVETIRVAAHDPREMMTFLWVTSSDLDRLDDALRDDHTTEEAICLSTADQRALYRITWPPEVQESIEIFTQARRTLLGAQGQADSWEFRVLFPDETSISTAYNNWRTHDIDPSIQRINDVSGMVACRGVDISPCQHETLIKAFEAGYYNVPREINLDGLAATLDISHQALSERLRRGHRNLVKTALCDSPTAVRHAPYQR